MSANDLFAILKDTADAAFVVDDLGFVCFWNGSAENLFHYPPSEALNKSCWELLDGRNSHGGQCCSDGCHVLELATNSPQIPHFELDVKLASGRRGWVDVSILVYCDPRTGRRYIAHLIRDIGVRKKAEELADRVLQATKELAELSRTPVASVLTVPLTEQERKVLRLLADGKRPEDVVAGLKISPRTFRNHIHNVNRKLGTKSRLEAVIHATRKGLI